MEMLKFLTQKLKVQSLNEVQPFQPSEEVDEDRDSGTESDEENAELEALQRAMEESDVQLNPQTMQLPLPSSFSPSTSCTKKSLQLVNDSSSPIHAQHTQQTDLIVGGFSGHSSPRGSSDFERCSLDFDPGSSTEFDRHSSEEELSLINCPNRELHPEKRKWSQVNRSSYSESSGSSDDEVKDLLSTNSMPQPVVFSSSPPRGVPRLNRTMSPKIFLANVTPAHIAHMCAVSPRKRHRQTSASDASEAPTVIQRPCLDFEKMQQKTLVRKHVPHGIQKAKIVKIRSITGSSRPPKCLYDPSVFAFRSISTGYNALTPVEEPSCAY